MDEKVGGEAQVCRLCGQYESIYIDVFGDEGTRRLLGLKIHSKINILIKEDDDLPKAICIRCVGTLEFLCDFAHQCQETQQKLSKKEDADPSVSTTSPRENDNEFNKENVMSKHKSLSPSMSRKSKTPVSPSSRELKNIPSHVESVQSVMEMSEKILSEIPYTKKEIIRNSQKRLPKIRAVTTLPEALRPLAMKSETNSVQKLVRKSPKAVKALEENVEMSSDPPKVELVESFARLVSAPKPLKIRPSLQKFIRNPYELSVTIVEGQKAVKTPAKTPEVVGTSMKLEGIKTEPMEVEAKVKELVEESDVSTPTAQGREIIQKPVKKPPQFPEEGRRQQNQEFLKKTISSTSPSTATAPEPTKSTDSSGTASKPGVKTSASKASEFPSESHTQAPAPGPSTASSSPTEAGELEEIDDRSQNVSEARENGSRLQRSRSSSQGPRGVSEEYLPQPGSRSSSSPPSKLTHNSRNSESSNSSECRRRHRSSSGSSSSSLPTSTCSSSKRRKSSGIYGTISQLISSEEKETIEKFYVIDMSVVDESAVEMKLNYIDKKQTMCLICRAVYPRIDKCRVHIWGHLDMKPYKCTACDFSTVTITNIRCHIRKSHLKIKPFECNSCKKRYVTAVLLEEHLNTHSGLRPFKCTVCSFSSASRQVLSYHMTTHKPVKDVTCEICGKEFFSKGRMRAHMITHNKNRELMCKFCSHHFSSADALQKHLDNVHAKDYVCGICGKSTKSRKALHNHQNVHSQAKFKCNLCPNVYKSGHILKEHLLKHEGIRKYKCEVCEKDFAQQSHLAAHMAVHSDKRFKCPGCQRAFNRHDNMKIHTKRCGVFKANPDLQDVLTTKIKKAKAALDEEIEGEKKVEEIDDVEGEGDDGDEDDGPLRREETFSIGQVMVIPISGGQRKECSVQEAGVSVKESVLGLECF
ncbi:zinc finger and BTB domain-containing protein 17-like isoform X2 [Diachasmimorpha longicaudata]|uniref:zinc finger and BTB domain-containing protein 17-like isoform X2 n=1 Tax=Diachasmimorpha longicaudata TaxID=58733 RepID=UPI0030B8A077